jgi:D-xylose transport system ATP-binding protein
MLEARSLSKRFGGVAALQEVSFDLQPGEIHALCGENGAGKSTLIKLLAGVHAHGSYSGEIRIGGREARFRSIRDAAAAGIAVIYQELAFIDELSVAANIFLGAEPRRFGAVLDRRTEERQATALLQRFGVAMDARAPLASLGVGQKQLVEIVRALARDSRILILDEPTAALAAYEVEVLLGILADLRRQGVSCIYVSHRLEEVMRIADRVTVLRDGATVATLRQGEFDPATIVRHMVGREITDLYAHPMTVPGAPVMEVAGLAVADTAGRPRLRDISLTLRAGEVVGLGGLMGAGRTELLMHLFGAWGRRTAGTVTLLGQPLPPGSPRAALRAGLALVTEDRRRFGLVAEESVGFNLSLSALGEVARSGIIGAAQEAARNREWLRLLQVRGAVDDAPVGRLSGGNQQKVVLARALMTRPRVVLLDEPTRGIDIGAKQEIYALVHRLTAGGCAVAVASSDLSELIGISDRILMLRDGHLTGEFDRAMALPENLLAAGLGHPISH